MSEKGYSHEDMENLWEMGIAFVGDPASELWMALGGSNLPNKVWGSDSVARILSPGQCVYMPKNPDDWAAHPGSARVINVVVVTPHTQGRAFLQELQYRTLLFLVPPAWVKGLLNGSRSISDLDAELEKNDPDRNQKRKRLKELREKARRK